MLGASGGKLAGAVSRAGGLGFVAWTRAYFLSPSLLFPYHLRDLFCSNKKPSFTPSLLPVSLEPLPQPDPQPLFPQNFPSQGRSPALLLPSELASSYGSSKQELKKESMYLLQSQLRGISGRSGCSLETGRVGLRSSDDLSCRLVWTTQRRRMYGCRWAR